MRRSVPKFKITFKVMVALGALFAGSFAIYHLSDKKSETEMVVAAQVCRCQPGRTEDPFERPLKYRYGYYAGRCIDSCEYRYTEIIEANESQDYIEVSNLYHEKKFWRARIPLHAVEGVEISFENFRKSFNHVAMRFQFPKSNPVKLISQVPEEGEYLTSETQSLVVSPEGVAPKGSEYNLFDGMLGYYSLMYRIFSMEQYEIYANELDRPLKTYKTKLKKDEMNDLLLVSIQKSSEGLNGVYQLVFNNCATATIDLILESQKKLVSPHWDIWDVIDPLRGVPLSQGIGTLSSLQWWDLIDTKTHPRIILPKKKKREL